MTYRPPPVRPSTRIFRVLVPSGRKRQAQAFCICIAMLCAAASANATPGTVAAKQAQAQQVLTQIQKIDDSLGAAVESYNLANVRLRQIERDQRENRRQLKLTRANLKIAQDSLAARLVSAYTSTQDNSTLSVLLGAASLDDLLNRIEAVNSTSRQDASIVQQVTSFKAAIQHNRDQLRKAHSEQRTIVAQKAAQKQRIQSQLASRRQLLSSITNVHGGVVGIAMRYLGVPYVWGGSTPRGFDCSGFVAYVFAQIGVSLPHSSYAMFGMGTPVSIGELQPGDLVFFTGASHMGIYIGGGQFIHSPHTGDVVKISSLSGYYSSNFAGGRRV